jgi:hypothetical protein
MMMRWLLLAFALAARMAPCIAQELSLPEAERVPVPQPQNVRVEHHEDQLLINWDVTPIKRVTAYEVFKKIEGEVPIAVAKLPKPPYVTSVPASARTEFFVVAIDYRNNRSKPSKPVTVETEPKK